MDNVRLRIKHGEKEFEIEGPAQDVSARWEEAKRWLLQEGPKIDRTGAGGLPAVEGVGDLIFDRDMARGTIRLRILPPRGKILQRVSQSLLLLLHGYQSFLEQSQIPVTRLAEDLRLSGFADLRRLSRAFAKLEAEGLAIRSGRGKGTTYRTTHPGKNAAIHLLKTLGNPEINNTPT